MPKNHKRPNMAWKQPQQIAAMTTTQIRRSDEDDSTVSM
ncbi:hypothetical protein CPter91_1365 [Collimonas pratensis]|uniref:Uncharacterized protein n=1 Tax=Collimonas pratensis TaxID=279113 RepID=A0A127Q170_9BURK|nr:hypothetical protein CPter91_1365 [Collimonas pratensis]